MPMLAAPGVSAASCVSIAAVFVLILCLVLSWQGLLPWPRSKVYCYGEALRVESGNGGSPLSIKFLSTTPSIRLIEHFVTPSEAGHIIKKYAATLDRSTVVAGDGNEVTTSRTSQSGFLPAGTEDAVIAALEERAALLTGLPVSHWETLQLTHYVTGQEYHPHFDFFDDSDNNRAVTIFVYLNDVPEEQGGQTEFVRAGVTVRPVLGNAVVWFNCAARGREVVCDEDTEHAGRPPESGEKYGLNMWARSMPYR